MGPYYRGTSQGVGQFFDLFYQYPLLMLLLATAGLAGMFFLWFRFRARK